MRHELARWMLTLTVVTCAFGRSELRAQSVEVAPFIGYRFGGDFFELVTGQRVDLDGAPALGVVVDVDLQNGFVIEGLFTRQHADFVAPIRPSGAPRLWRVAVDHWQGGGLQEFASGRARPFLTGTLGLTRYAADADSEIRFTAGAGGGVKLFPLSHVGVRLDGRLFATFVDAGASTVACSPFAGGCLLALDAHIVWQTEFTAGITVRFR